jgi:hypothetical protein
VQLSPLKSVVFSTSRVVFLKYITLKAYLVFSAHYSKNTFFKLSVTAFTVGYFGRVKLCCSSCSSHTFSCFFSCEVTCALSSSWPWVTTAWTLDVVEMAWSCGSSVGIISDYILDERGSVRGRGKEFFFYPLCPEQL